MAVGSELPFPQAPRSKRRRTGLSSAPRTGVQRSRQLKLYFANVTSWGAVASDYLKESSALAHCDVMCIAEHHKQGGALHQHIKTLQKCGWAESRAHSGHWHSPGKGGKRTRGVWAGVKSNLDSKGLSREAKTHLQQPEHAGSSTQRSSRTLRMKGYDIIITAVYLATGLGLQGSNVTVMQKIGVYLNATNQPFVVLGDFNIDMTVDEIAPLEMETFLSVCWLSQGTEVPGDHKGERPRPRLRGPRRCSDSGLGPRWPLGPASCRTPPQSGSGGPLDDHSAPDCAHRHRPCTWPRRTLGPLQGHR